MGAGDGDGEPGRSTEGRLTGLLPDEVELELDRVERRRQQLLFVGGVAAFGSATITYLVLTVGTIELPVWVGWVLLVVTGLFVLQAVAQERTLDRLTRRAAAQKQRGEVLASTVTDVAALLTTARRVNDVLLPEEVYEVVVDEAMTLLDAVRASIRLRVGDVLAVAASRGPDAPPLGATVAVEDDPAVVVVTLGADVVEEQPPRLALPVTVGTRHVGVLEVERAADAAPFTQRQVLFGRLFAEEAAAAFVNANRYDLERARVEQLAEDRKERTEAIADTVHDLRAPLSSVLACAELLQGRRHDMPADRVDDIVDVVLTESRRMKALVDEVFEAASTESHVARHQELVDVGSVVREAADSAELSAAVDGGRVRVEVAGVPVVMADPEALRRVVTNLVANGLEHASREVEVLVRSRHGECLVHVADRGPGISQEDLPRLFRRRRDEPERGRGLRIVESLVRGMGGRVGVRSRLGVGSVFTVVLPEVDVAAITPAPPNGETTAPLSGETTAPLSGDA